MKPCETCGADISHRRSNARYCSKECKKAKPANKARTCEICGSDLSHRPKAKYCEGECAQVARQQKRRDRRADPDNREKERLSRNASQNAKYQNDPAFREQRKAASSEYYWSNRETCLAKGKARREIKAQDPDCVESERARKRTPEYHATRNARQRERWDTDPVFRQKELDRNAHNFQLHPEWLDKARQNHKDRMASDSAYRQRNRDYHRKWQFGMAPGEFAEKRTNQDGLCAICRNTNQGGKDLAVDHAHDSGQVRDLLCDPCNQGIGKFAEDPNRILAAADYLNRAPMVPKDIPRVSDSRVAELFKGYKFNKRSKDSSLKASYGIDLAQYGWMLEEGDGVCWICRQHETAIMGRNGKDGATGPSSLHVDHDHDDPNGGIRGLLCLNCNNGIGIFREDAGLLKAAAAYLSQWNGDTVQPKLLDG